jgi:mono/diheme cytochrome c family protein
METTMKLSVLAGLAGATVLAGLVGLTAAQDDPMKPRVPADQLAAAKKLASPVKVSAGVVAEGKALFEGKGTCFNCHGKSGKGDGPVGAALTPKPRDLTNCEFQKKRADGELFWVIKNGSPGTAMVPLVPPLSEEEAWKVIAYVRSFCK